MLQVHTHIPEQIYIFSHFRPPFVSLYCVHWVKKQSVFNFVLDLFSHFRATGLPNGRRCLRMEYYRRLHILEMHSLRIIAQVICHLNSLFLLNTNTHIHCANETIYFCQFVCMPCAFNRFYYSNFLLKEKRKKKYFENITFVSNCFCIHVYLDVNSFLKCR